MVTYKLISVLESKMIVNCVGGVGTYNGYFGVQTTCVHMASIILSRVFFILGFKFFFF